MPLPRLRTVGKGSKSREGEREGGREGGREKGREGGVGKRMSDRSKAD